MKKVSIQKTPFVCSDKDISLHVKSQACVSEIEKLDSAEWFLMCAETQFEIDILSRQTKMNRQQKRKRQRQRAKLQIRAKKSSEQ